MFLYLAVNNNIGSAVNQNITAINVLPIIPALNDQGVKIDVSDNGASLRCQYNDAMTTSQQQQQQHLMMTDLKPVTQAAYYQQTHCVPLYSQHYSE